MTVTDRPTEGRSDEHAWGVSNAEAHRGRVWDSEASHLEQPTCDINSGVMSASGQGGAPVAAEPVRVAPLDHMGAGRIGMWIFLITDGMGFGALLLAYGVLRTRAVGWPDPMERFLIPVAAAMTLTLLTSSMAVLLALSAADEGRGRAARGWLAATILCGLGFLAGQGFEYHHLMHDGVPMGLTSGLFASLFYVITGFHGLHVAAGLLVLGVVMLGRGAGPAWASRV